MTICVHEVFVLWGGVTTKLIEGKGFKFGRWIRNQIYWAAAIKKYDKDTHTSKLYITVKNWGDCCFCHVSPRGFWTEENSSASWEHSDPTPSASLRGPMPAFQAPAFQALKAGYRTSIKSLLTAHTSYPQLCNFWATLRGELVTDEGPLLPVLVLWACGCRGCRRRTSRSRIPEPKGWRRAGKTLTGGYWTDQGLPYVSEVMTNGAHQPTSDDCLARPPCNWEDSMSWFGSKILLYWESLRYGAFESFTTSKGIQSDASMSKFFPLKKSSYRIHRKVQFR